MALDRSQEAGSQVRVCTQLGRGLRHSLLVSDHITVDPTLTRLDS